MELQPVTKDVPQGHPDTAATGMFLVKQHSELGTALPHETMGVLCANNTTINSTTTRQLNLSPALPAKHKKETHSMKWTNHSSPYQYYVMQDVKSYLENTTSR